MPKDDNPFSAEEKVHIPGVDPMTREPERQGPQLPGTTMYVVYRQDGQGSKGDQK
jgi:hypothetical protein